MRHENDEAMKPMKPQNFNLNSNKHHPVDFPGETLS